ncbi:MAG: hypothetical protein PVF73_08325 [Bacteroidales bacterium]|jgi:type IV pilus assembly protein PilQ
MHLKQISLSIVISILTEVFVFSAAVQDPYERLDSLLTARSEEIPALNSKVSISVSDVTLDEFLRGVANSSGLNLDVEPGLDFRVVNNFANVEVKDMLVFICRQYELDIKVTGNIISIVKAGDGVYSSSESVKWDKEKQLITLDYTNVPVEQVVREITQKTDANVILAPNARGKTISAYIRSTPLKTALDKLAYSNALLLTRSDDKFFILEQEIRPQDIGRSQAQEGSVRSRTGRRSAGSGDYLLQVDMVSEGIFDITASNAPVTVVLEELSGNAGFSYFISPQIEDVVSMQLRHVTVNDILNNLFGGTEIGFRKTDNIYLIGERNLFDFNEHKVIRLQNRSIETLLEYIPEDIKENLHIIEFPELNSLLVSGAAYQVKTFENFISDIDKVVPVIMIEVIIMYVNKSAAVATGIQAGLADEPVPTRGTAFPGIDMQLGAPEINEILNNMGLVNLGKVTPNFYITLQALEEQGYIDMSSTPRLATLNGHEATLSIGNTEYYLEEQTHLYGTQNPQQTTSQEYKAINAELSVKIRPVLSADEQITLEIEVRQSDFTERISKTAPPGSVNREFTSNIRVKNQEMILLGGLMEKRKSDSGSGTPLLARIPVIKWLFSSRKYEKSESKFSVLIKPTIVN